MSRVTLTRDDLTGQEISEPGKPVKITIDGKSHELDLTDGSRDALTALLTGNGTGLRAFMDAMVSAGALNMEPAKPSRARKSGGSKPGKTGTDYAAVREWAATTEPGRAAAAKSYPDRKGSAEPVPSRGRVAPELVSAWQAATGAGKPITPPANVPDAPGKTE